MTSALWHTEIGEAEAVDIRDEHWVDAVRLLTRIESTNQQIAERLTRMSETVEKHEVRILALEQINTAAVARQLQVDRMRTYFSPIVWAVLTLLGYLVLHNGPLILGIIGGGHK